MELKVCDPSKMEVIPLGFDLDRFQVDAKAKRQTFRAEFGLASDDIAIGIVGRVTAIKNHAHFIKSIAKLKQSTNLSSVMAKRWSSARNLPTP